MGAEGGGVEDSLPFSRRGGGRGWGLGDMTTLRRNRSLQFPCQFIRFDSFLFVEEVEIVLNQKN